MGQGTSFSEDGHAELSSNVFMLLYFHLLKEAAKQTWLFMQ